MKKTKKNIIALEVETDESQYDDMAMLMFHTVAPNYAFVDDLNHLYNIALSRADDLPIDGVQWPLFVYRSSLMHLKYYLVERPPSHEAMLPSWTTGHKLLIAIGKKAKQTLEFIDDEFSMMPTAVDENDLIATEHAQRLNAMRSSFTTTSLIDISTIPAGMSRKGIRDFNTLCDIINDILDYLDMKYISES